MELVEYLNQKTKGVTENKERGYLGMSMIGTPCRRSLQYSMYMASGDGFVDKRIGRLFNDGHAFEDKLLTIFKDLGIIIGGRQVRLKDDTGMWNGHIDGCFTVENDEWLLEIKTHNDKNFKTVAKQGVKKAKPVHYDQMMIYMGYGKWDRCLYAAYNKNDSDLYFEEVLFDQKHFDSLVAKANDIIASDALYPRIGNNSAAWFECKFCSHRDVCFGMEQIQKGCRTCAHCEAHNDNKWTCNNELVPESNLSFDMQKQGCDNHLYSVMFNEA